MLELESEIKNSFGWVIITLSETEHPLSSITSHVHIPEPRTVCDVVILLLHKILKGPVPPEMIAEIGVNPP